MSTEWKMVEFLKISYMENLQKERDLQGVPSLDTKMYARGIWRPKTSMWILGRPLPLTGLHGDAPSKPSFLSVKQSGKKSALKNVQGGRQRQQHVTSLKQWPLLLHVPTVEETARPSSAFSATAKPKIPSNCLLLWSANTKILKYEWYPIVRHDLRGPTTTTTNYFDTNGLWLIRYHKKCVF